MQGLECNASVTWRKTSGVERIIANIPQSFSFYKKSNVCLCNTKLARNNLYGLGQKVGRPNNNLIILNWEIERE